MRCLVINLDRSIDRLAHVTAEFARIGMPFERVAAMDASAEDDPHVFDIGIANGLSAGETACFISHRICWRLIAEGNEPYAAVFEDDVVFSDGAEHYLADARWLPRGADLVKLETFFHKVPLGSARFAHHGHALHKLDGPHAGSAGYILSRKAARKLLWLTEHLPRPVDLVLFWPDFGLARHFVIFQLVPAICMQAQFRQDTASALPSVLTEGRLRKRRADMQHLPRLDLPRPSRIWSIPASIRWRLRRALKRLQGSSAKPDLIVVPFGRDGAEKSLTAKTPV